MSGIESQIEKLREKSGELAELQASEDMTEMSEIMGVVAANLSDDLLRSVEMKKMVLRS